jgi:hypothetical protein
VGGSGLCLILRYYPRICPESEKTKKNLSLASLQTETGTWYFRNKKLDHDVPPLPFEDGMAGED